MRWSFEKECSEIMSYSVVRMDIVLVGFMVAILLQGSLSDEVRGVNPGKKQFYKTQKDFTCLDGSMTIPFSLVNDDYCDCRWVRFCHGQFICFVIVTCIVQGGRNIVFHV